MGRLFFMLFTCALLLAPHKPAQMQPAQPVFFSMLFPQLIPDSLWDFSWERAAEEAVCL